MLGEDEDVAGRNSDDSSWCGSASDVDGDCARAGVDAVDEDAHVTIGKWVSLLFHRLVMYTNYNHKMSG
jgi:hypothetical protein